MTFRIKNSDELTKLVKGNGLSKSVETQLQNAFSILGTAKQGSSLNHMDIASRSTSVAADRDKRQQRAHFYVLPEYDPSPDPAVVLYRTCVKKWGRYFDGGEVVWELTIANPRRFSFDLALPRYRIAIEFDGFQYHSTKDSIKRDHEKTEQIATLGWLLFRIGKSRVMDESALGAFLDSVDFAMCNAVEGLADVELYGGVKSKSFRSQLKSWKPQVIKIPSAFQLQSV